MSQAPFSPNSPAGRAVSGAPSVTRWIEASAGRHYITLLISTAIIVVADLLGARIDFRAYVVMGVWIVTNGLMSAWAARPAEIERRIARYAWTIVADVAFLGATYLFLDAAQYLGAVFFAHMALIAAATLPRRWAIAIGAFIVVVYGTLVLLAASDVALVDSPIGLPSVHGNRLFVVAGIASVVGMVTLLLHLQGKLVKSIRDAERRYVTLVQSAADMVMTFNDEGRFLDANPATLEQSGYTWDEIKQLPNTTFFPASDWAAVNDAFRRTLMGESLRYDVRFVRRDGTERWAQTSTSPLTLDGRPAVLVIARDITDARRQTEELREKDARLRIVLGALNVGFITFDRDRRVTSMFGAWAREREAHGTSVIGSHLHELLNDGNIIEQHQRADDRVLAGEDMSVSWRLDSADGERWYRTHLVPLRDRAGAIAGGAGLWVDETALVVAGRERAELRRRVADAERVESLGKLVSGVAHELNNPLAAILNFTEELLAEPRSPDERNALEVIQAQALRSRTIVRDLLTYARRENARPKSSVVPRPILETLARAMRPGLATQGVAFVVELEHSERELLLDRAGFEQVVTNLIANAAHAAGAGGTVRLSSRMQAAYFEVIVEDNGAGISPEVAQRMFEPFFTTKPTGQGVGLGLSVSMGIVQAHGGVLLVENRPADAGGGARFIMRLPTVVGGAVTHDTSELPMSRITPGGGVPSRRRGRPSEPREAITEPPSGPKALPERKPTILIIDDEGAIRQGLRRFLTRRGWVVEESADGADALSKLLRPEAVRIYDVVLCDLKMAGVSGMDVYDRAARDAPLLARRFILSTGDTTAPDVAGFLALAPVPVLEKPFELAALESLANEVRSASAADPSAGERGPA